MVSLSIWLDAPSYAGGGVAGSGISVDGDVAGVGEEDNESEVVSGPGRER